MYFLIGLGIIVIIVYGNMLYDRIKTKKNKDTTDVERSAGTADTHLAEQKETKGQKTEINGQALDQDQSGSMVKTAGEYCFFSPTLTQMIADDLKQKKHIFGLPLTLCEELGDGQLIALDREDIFMSSRPFRGQIMRSFICRYWMTWRLRENVFRKMQQTGKSMQLCV